MLFIVSLSLSLPAGRPSKLLDDPPSSNTAAYVIARMVQAASSYNNLDVNVNIAAPAKIADQIREQRASGDVFNSYARHEE
jgi:hypothetical protein